MKISFWIIWSEIMYKIVFINLGLILSLCSFSDELLPIYSMARPLNVGMVTDAGAIDDKSFNEATWNGILNATKVLPVAGAWIKPTGTTEKDYLLEIQNLYNNGYFFIITPGFKFETAIYHAQQRYRGAKFVLLDGIPHPGNYEALVSSNTVSIFFQEQEAAFLAGVAMALQLKEGEVGFIGGMEIPPVQQFDWGFRQGISYVNSQYHTDVRMKVKNRVFQGSFDNVAAGQQIASRMYDDGVKAIFQAAGGVGVGAINEAKARAMSGDEVWIIGVDMDQYDDGLIGDDKSVILTSALKRMDLATYKMIELEMKGSFPGGKVLTLGITDNCVGIPDENPNLDAEVEEKVRKVAAAMKRGEIVVQEKMDEYLVR